MQNKILKKWEEKTLDEICEINYGTRVVKNKNAGIIYPVYGGGGATFSIDTYNREDCLIVARFAMSEKCTRFVNGKFFLNDSGLTVKSNINELNQNFLDWQLISLNDKIYSLGRGSAQKNLNVDLFKKLQIKYPLSRDEQQRIVGILDEAFENIEKAKQNALQNLNNAKELFESYLTSILVNKDNWNKKKLSEVAIDFGRGRSRHRPRNDKKLYGGQYPFIQTGEIRNSNHFITEYSQTYNEIGLAQSKLWPKGTLCITIAANIAETGVLTFDACFPDSVIGCVFDETRTNIDYVEYLLQSFKTILQAEGKGSAQDNINLGTFEKHSFPFPDKTKQDEIVDKLNCMRANIAKLEQIYEQKIKDLDELKQSILQKAFNGEL